MTFEEGKKMLTSAVEKQRNISNLLASETNAQPLYRVIGAIAAMDKFSKALKANLDAQGNDWRLLYDAVMAATELEIASVFVNPNAMNQKNESEEKKDV